MTIHAVIRERERIADAARRAAEEAERQARFDSSQKLGRERQAERDRRAAEAEAEADRAYAIKYANMTPFQREIADHARKTLERLATAPATTTATKRQAMSYEPAHRDPGDAEALKARAEAMAARALAEPSEANRCAALLAESEAGKARALARFQAETRAADEAVRAAERAAGDDPAARARARAQVIGDRAGRLGEAESAHQRAELEHDRAVVDAAVRSKLAAHRIESRKQAVRADEAKALSDPHAIGNPYYKPPISLADWQLEALDPAARRRAIDDGVVVYSDPPPSFTAADAQNILRMRGSHGRAVVTRAEFAAMTASEQAKAARSAIIVD